ncbi:90 kDa surface protein, putative,serine-alanine-and proline-rich protein, putative [Trypanosoma cruzi marinkellei]|uniref:90 kDa surface protein, putative,serine-alanine-and proline-rich protein, putative n=1 Tax=Trypanosoma cruzi marinkellei TaxID=85056 RepID=K2N2D4_TRYCR|nr:90 kDa surface protein, putative,serine-alanine-and proline-rich protein, putative [Trypanosoma cruzi marinkellei]
MLMSRVFCVVLALTLLCCCSCVFAVEEGEEVLQVNAVCAEGGGKVGRWQLRGKSLWYNCTDSASGFGQVICDMGVGNCEPEEVEKRKNTGANDGVFTINVTSTTPIRVKNWWEREVESKAATVASVPATPPAAGLPASREGKALGDTSARPDSESPPAGAADSADAPLLATSSGSAGEGGPATRPEAGAPVAQEEAPRDTSTKNSESPPGAAGTTDPSSSGTSRALDSAPAR